MPPATAPGLVGNAFALGDSPVLGTEGLPSVVDAVSVEMWVRAVPSQTVQTLASRWSFPDVDDAARSFHLWISPDGRLVWETDDVTLRRPQELSADVPQLFDGVFHHVAATRDRTTVMLYVDGSPVASAASFGGALNPAPGVPFRLGTKTGLGTMFAFTGEIDEAAVYDRALSPADVSAIATAGDQGKCPRVSAVFSEAAESGLGHLVGPSVAVDGDTIAVGFPFDATPGGIVSGVVQIYTRTNGAWTAQATLTASDATEGDQFGRDIDLDGDTLVVGAPGRQDPFGGDGAAFAFRRSGAAWTEEAVFVGGGDSQWYGLSVATNGGSAVIGEFNGQLTAAARVYERSAAGWSAAAELQADDLAPNDLFGYTVDISGSRIVAAAIYDDTSAGTDAGSVYVFTKSAGTWTQTGKVTSPWQGPFQYFGALLDLDGARLAAYAIVEVGGEREGSVQVFDDIGLPGIAELLTSDDLGASTSFGTPSLDGDLLVIGSPAATVDGVTGVGRAHVYRHQASGWTHQADLMAPDTEPFGSFGGGVVVSGDTAVVSWQRGSSGSSERAAAVAFDL